MEGTHLGNESLIWNGASRPGLLQRRTDLVLERSHGDSHVSGYEVDFADDEELDGISRKHMEPSCRKSVVDTLTEQSKAERVSIDESARKSFHSRQLGIEKRTCVGSVQLRNVTYFLPRNHRGCWK